MPDRDDVIALGAIFAALEQSSEADITLKGVRQQRLRTASTCELFVAVRKPSLLRELTARFHDSVLPVDYQLPDFRTLEVHHERINEDGIALSRITIRSTQTAFNEIFTSFANDIVQAVGTPTDEVDAAIALQRRLDLWQRLLEKTGPPGLTEDQQQGLFGELWCLCNVVLSTMSLSIGINTWSGPDGADRDFQFAEAVALEVKTTRSSGNPMLSISSERQLDYTGLNALYLMHLALEKQQSAGQSLPQIVVSLRTLFHTDPLAASAFEDKLLAAGYLDLHVPRYQHAGYTIYGVNLYWVQEGFPRIVPRDLLAGVGRVHYTIAAIACQPFAIALESFAAQLGASE